MKKIYFVVLIALSFVACKKDRFTGIKTGPGNPIDTGHNPSDTSYLNVVTLAVDQTHPGNTISPNFEGLSFETLVLAKNPEYLNPGNTVFVNLIKNLGPGLLRIGGGTSDKITWTSTARTSSTPPNNLTTTDIDQLSAFSKLIGWPVLFGLNLGTNQVAASANEAAYVYNSLGSNLSGFQFGNEPNYFVANGLRQGNYAANNFLDDWDIYYANVKAAAPQAFFAGPDVVQGSNWVNSFADVEHNKVNLIDAHYYLEGPATSTYINYHDLLNTDFGLPIFLQGLKSASSKYGLPYRVTECNNIWGGGKPGTSDVFASALWGLDFMWTVAENNGQGINFHDGEGIFYSPLTMSAGVAVVHPEYYAMLAFSYAGSGGTIIPIKMGNTGFSVSAFACVKADKSYSITLINKEENTNIAFDIQLSSSASSIQVARLKAPSATSSDKVTFAGTAVNADGTFTPVAITPQTINQKDFKINVPGGSAAVVTIR